MKQYDYSNISSVEQLYEQYNLKSIKDILLEKKEVELPGEDGKKDEDEPSKVVNPDKLEVKYSDLKQDLKNIFKHIIVFTNDRDPKNNKTLKNIYDAVDALKKAKCEIVPEVHVFIAADIDADDDENEIVITDGDEKMVIKEESNIDTLIFSRLGVQDEDQCEHIVKVLQDRGFLVLNPVQYSALACNKYDSAVLFKKGDIPQPRFSLMTKDVLYDEKLYEEAMKELYPKWDIKDSDKNEDFMVVMKILDGHGGTGVALIDGKRIYAVLQMIFAIDPEQRILLQKKEEADGGDIRIHVLTLRDKQIILAAMKRVKLGGDFRSNVSLGAEAEPVKLTPEQERILSGGAIQNYHGLPVAARIFPLNHAVNLLQLFHQVLLVMKTACGITKKHIRISCFGCSYGVKYDCCRVRALFLGNNFYLSTVCPFCQLFNSCRTEGIRCRHEHFFPICL